MSGNTLRRLRPVASRVGRALVLVCAGTAASAAPDPSDDPLGHFLAERAGSAAAPAAAATEAARVGDPTADMVLAAMNFLDVPYRRGGNDGDTGFDCSGFTRHVYGLSLGLALPRRVDEQAGASGLVKVQRSELRPGDLVFFNTLRRTYSHVGIYIGEGRFIHSPRTGAQVRVEDMRTAYWNTRYTGARRAGLVASATPVAAAAVPVRTGGPGDRVAESMYWLH
jgi:cell wall-associated NlpC family hydrolase